MINRAIGEAQDPLRIRLGVDFVLDDIPIAQVEAARREELIEFFHEHRERDTVTFGNLFDRFRLADRAIRATAKMEFRENATGPGVRFERFLNRHAFVEVSAQPILSVEDVAATDGPLAYLLALTGARASELRRSAEKRRCEGRL